MYVNECKNTNNTGDVLSKSEFEKIKLIIWDMDDTFWKGTLSEGNILCPEENILLIKLLSANGIVNSISSKNDSEAVIAKLEELEEGLSKYFVFNSINWDEKGKQIADKLSRMKLRAENALFIDDSIRNLEEAVAANSGLMTVGPEAIALIQKYIVELIEKAGCAKDPQYTRLNQYHMLEEKDEAKKLYSSNEQFLYDSEIVVDISFDCFPQLDRIAELVERTNQLNYTKQRSSRSEIEKSIFDDWKRCAYISARDKFGDYGIVGFFCYNRLAKKMEHFLFSCRVMGMGIEQYVYSRMEYPYIDVAEPVAVKLEKGKNIPWIKEDYNKTAANQLSEKNCNRVRILLKGPCDLSAIEQYLIGGAVTGEFNFVNSDGFVTTGQNHSVHIYEGANVPADELQVIYNDAPFLRAEDFDTLLFKKEYGVICYSLLPDCHAGLYMHKNTGLFASFGSVNFDLTDEQNWAGYIDGSISNHFYPFTEEICKNFKDKWEYVGTTPDEMLLYNLEYMYENAPGNPVFIILLGSEIEYEGDNPEFADHAHRHKVVNDLVKRFAEDKQRIRIINMTDYVHGQDDYEDSINHFSRRVYYDVATKVVEYINDKVSKG